MATKRFKVLTLNAWAIALPYPLGSRDRIVRISAIAKAIADGNYDIVALQEIWSETDYEIIRARVSDALPNAVYFHSGYVGSGVCIFTKGTIRGTFMHRYSLNGYPHHVHRGDWFGGKVVGLARIFLNGVSIDLYATHLHAEYDKDNDLYLPHRVLQSYELSQFINETTRGDMAIVVGDLNLEPTDFGYQLIVSTAGLTDSYEMAKNFANNAANDPTNGATCEVPTNSYVSTESLKRWPQGKRIDYVLFRANEKVNVVCRECKTALGRIPENPDINYSDHEAVCAILEVTASDKQPENKKRAEFPDHAINLIDMGIASTFRTRRLCAALVVVLAVFFIYTINIEVAYKNTALTIAALIARFTLTLLIGFIFVYGLVGLKMEQKALAAARCGMLALKNANSGQ